MTPRVLSATTFFEILFNTACFSLFFISHFLALSGEYLGWRGVLFP